MQNIATTSQQQILITVDDASLVKDLKRAIKMMRGVSRISVIKPKKTDTQMALEDVKAGRISEYASKKELFDKLGL